MEITQHPRGELLELRLNGRIDATWGDHLSTTIEKAVRAGSHHIALNCSGVDYISSLGIGVIVRHYNELKSVNGSLVVTYPSKFVRQILDTVGLTNILIDSAGAPTAAPASARREVRGGAAYQIHPQLAGQPLSCTLIGDPGKLTTTGFSASDCRSLTFPAEASDSDLVRLGQASPIARTALGSFWPWVDAPSRCPRASMTLHQITSLRRVVLFRGLRPSTHCPAPGTSPPWCASML